MRSESLLQICGTSGFCQAIGQESSGGFAARAQDKVFSWQLHSIVTPRCRENASHLEMKVIRMLFQTRPASSSPALAHQRLRKKVTTMRILEFRFTKVAKNEPSPLGNC